MTEKTRQIEEEFNRSMPRIKQGELGNSKTKFNKELFLKSARELQEIIQTNDRQESLKSTYAKNQE